MTRYVVLVFCGVGYGAVIGAAGTHFGDAPLKFIGLAICVIVLAKIEGAFTQ